MDPYTIAWIIWLLSFVVIEGLALRSRRRGDTLSEHVWRWTAIKGEHRSVRTWIGRALLLAGGVWLTGHLGLGWWSF